MSINIAWKKKEPLAVSMGARCFGRKQAGGDVNLQVYIFGEGYKHTASLGNRNSIVGLCNGMKHRDTAYCSGISLLMSRFSK